MDKIRYLFLSLFFISISISAQNSSKKISDKLMGIFFEDLNYAADGGLYAELVQNRSFEYSPTDVDLKTNQNNNWHFFTAWSIVREPSSIGTLSLESSQPIHPNNPHYLMFTTSTVGNKGVGIRNSGFNGITIKKNEKYNFSIFMKAVFGENVPVIIQLVDKDNKVLVESKLVIDSADWKKYSVSFSPNLDADIENASLVLLFQKKSKVALDMVSLFPENTFKNRPNGLRNDLAQTIAALKPGFVRFPGGCLAHGDGVDNIYSWKRTIGPVEGRLEDRNIWNYHQSFGLGYFEYLQFCEDIGAIPLPVMAAGVSCQNSSRSKGTGQECVPMENMDQYIQDILDFVEYCNGGVSTTWGKKRAEAGHPKPFNLEYIGIGNEDKITPEFNIRFKMICEKIKETYPNIKLVGTSGPSSEGEDFDLGWETAKKAQVAVVDEHFYKKPIWFLENLNRYDSYSRTAPKVYLGEYASQGNKLFNALAEAAFMTGLERNGDVVEFASYAPLLAKIGFTQWNPDMIYFDNNNVYPTINYYVQQLFSVNRGTVYFGDIIGQDKNSKELASSCVQDSKTGDIILKFVNPTDKVTTMMVDLKIFKKIVSNATLTVLSGDKDAVNSPKENNLTLPVKSDFKVTKSFDYKLPAYSVSVIRIKTRNK